ncbi:MAG: hypothetical protein VR64_00400 [Desulfatitalea sp. BRH_c12]|nr:MAG: hypothetical protein VR64_00400 [Desulfatitalea sp. BRH_c12]
MIDFDQTTAAFAADPAVTALLGELNIAGVFTDTDSRDRTLTDAENAREHLQYSLSPRKTGLPLPPRILPASKGSIGRSTPQLKKPI